VSVSRPGAGAPHRDAKVIHSELKAPLWDGFSLQLENPGNARDLAIAWL